MIHIKDPSVSSGPRGETVLIFCHHPYCWSCSSAGIVIRSDDNGEWGAPRFDVFRHGYTWDVAISRLTCRLPLPKIGVLADMEPLSLWFYDGGECLTDDDRTGMFQSVLENPQRVAPPADAGIGRKPFGMAGRKEVEKQASFRGFEGEVQQTAELGIGECVQGSREDNDFRGAVPKQRGLFQEISAKEFGWRLENPLPGGVGHVDQGIESHVMGRRTFGLFQVGQQIAHAGPGVQDTTARERIGFGQDIEPAPLAGAVGPERRAESGSMPLLRLEVGSKVGRRGIVGTHA
jgi:hypothetical protein